MPLEWRIGGARVVEKVIPLLDCTRRCRGKMPLEWRIGGARVVESLPCSIAHSHPKEVCQLELTVPHLIENKHNTTS